MPPKSSPRRNPKVPEDAVNSSDAGDPSGPAQSATSLTAVGSWFDERLPRWFTGPVAVVADRDEVIITGTIAEPEVASSLSVDARVPVLLSQIEAFRDATRTERMQLAAVAQAHLQRHVSWAVRCGEVEQTFTNISTPIMTRLRFDERRVLDTLVDASIARTRSEALAWCVRLVGQHEDDWLKELREALVQVEQVRRKGPKP